MTSPPGPPSGWYNDPQGVPVERWWDGVRWTEHTKRFPQSQPGQYHTGLSATFASAQTNELASVDGQQTATPRPAPGLLNNQHHQPGPSAMPGLPGPSASAIIGSDEHRKVRAFYPENLLSFRYWWFVFAFWGFCNFLAALVFPVVLPVTIFLFLAIPVLALLFNQMRCHHCRKMLPSSKNPVVCHRCGAPTDQGLRNAAEAEATRRAAQ